MVLWWLVFNLNKITWENLLLWQGITQHVPTIIIFILKAGGRLSLEKTKGETEACFYRQWKYLCVQANLFLISSPIRYVCSTSTSQFNFANLCFTNFHGIYFIYSSFFRLFMQFPWKVWIGHLTNNYHLHTGKRACWLSCWRHVYIPLTLYPYLSFHMD